MVKQRQWHRYQHLWRNSERCTFRDVSGTMFSNHLLGLEDVTWYFETLKWRHKHSEPMVLGVIYSCKLVQNVETPKILWDKDAPMQFERCLSPVQFHLNTECSSAAATRTKNQGRSQESSYWSKNNRRTWRQYAVSNNSGSVYLWQLKNQFSSFCPKHCFLNQGGYDGKSWKKNSHQRHQIDHQLQVVAEWVSLFPRCFHPGHVEQTSFLRPPKLSQGSWWFGLVADCTRKPDYIQVTGYCIMTKIYLEIGSTIN